MSLELVGLTVGILDALHSGQEEASAIAAENRYRQLAIAGQRRLLKLKADDAIRRGEEEVRNLSADYVRSSGDAAAEAAAQGISVSSLEGYDQEAMEMTEMDIATLRSNAQREALGFRMESEQLRQQSRILEMSSRRAQGSTVLTGAYRAAGRGLQLIGRIG